jgi:hypothetical protein
MESLMADADKFHDKVVGSIVRIRIPNKDQKQEMYRLVQVVGTDFYNTDPPSDMLNVHSKKHIMQNC